MKAYLITTGVLFALITVAHIWRALVESQLAWLAHQNLAKLMHITILP